MLNGSPSLVARLVLEQIGPTLANTGVVDHLPSAEIGNPHDVTGGGTLPEKFPADGVFDSLAGHYSAKIWSPESAVVFYEVTSPRFFGVSQLV